MTKPRRFVSLDTLFRMPSTSHAVVDGDDIWIQGLLGTVGDGVELAFGGVGAETVQACANLDRVLSACGAASEDIVRLDVLLRDTADFLGFEAAIKDCIPIQPARTIAYVNELPVGARVEVTARARIREAR